MSRRRANEVMPGTSFANPIWHKGFRIYSYRDPRNPQYSYQFVGGENENIDPNAFWGKTSTIAGAKTKIDQILGDAKS